MGAPPSPRPSLRLQPPGVLEVGRGTAVLLEGTCAGGLRTIEVRVGGRAGVMVSAGIPWPDAIIGDEWWQAVVPIPAITEPEEAAIVLSVRARDRASASAELGAIPLTPGPAFAPEAKDAGDSVAICLATFEPPIDLLRDQIESIRAQTHAAWTCIVSDDGSSEDRWQAVVDLVGDDERFRLLRSTERAGFYRNFERALREVPPDAAYVALADQDDCWASDKLATLIGALTPGASLVHSDASVVTEHGEPVSSTLWPDGPPRDDDLGELLHTSAVTGASALFRREVLGDALPFPPLGARAFHDRWLALVAGGLGEIARVDRPLFEYVQHPGAVLGHRGMAMGDGERSLRRGAPRPNWRAHHDEVLLRTVLEAHVLLLRLGDRMAAGERQACLRATRLPRSRSAQAAVAARYALKAPRHRPGLEGALVRGALWRSLVRGRTAAAHTRERLKGLRARGDEIVRDVRLPASPRARRRLQEALWSEPSGAPETGPLVSIVVACGDDPAPLRRLRAGLYRTAYGPFEVVPVPAGPAEVNAACRAAGGDLILLLDDAIEPASPGWLAAMVETIEGREAACVGARIVDPRRAVLRQRGMHFAAGAGVPAPAAIGAGEDPQSPEARAVDYVPAVSAACMLIRPTLLGDEGRLFDEDYPRGEADLQFRLRDEGHGVVCDGRAAVFQHDSPRSDAGASDRALFVDRRGPELARKVTADRLDGAGEWSLAPLRIGIAVSAGSDREPAGDLYVARELGEELERLGFEVVPFALDGTGWQRQAAAVDVILALLDRFPLSDMPRGVISVAWVRNWTDRWLEREWFDDYDLVLASSERSRSLIESRSSKAARLMPLATNPARFRPLPPDPDLAADITFVGSNWGIEREIARELPAIARDLDVKVFGSGWDSIPGHAGRLAYERVPAAYASAGLVVDDSGGHARPFGAVNSRVLDALACGALVASNDADGVRALFDDDFPTWADADDLRDHLERARSRPEEARRLVERYRAEVLERHTYRHRAEELRGALREWCESPRIGVAAGVPAHERPERWGDYHFARALQRQLERRGLPTRVHLLPAWDEEHAAADDVRLHLFGLSRLRSRSGQVNVIWNISHPAGVTPELLDAYDLALVASPAFAAELEGRTKTPVRPLAQATDLERFHPTEEPERYELLFVGNSRNVDRPAVAAAARGGHRLTIYGAGWPPALAPCVAGTGVPNRDLHRHYSAAAIVLNDHWPDMREHGFISNRVYDALASGACVVSDDVPGIAEEFDGAVATFDDPSELGDLLDRLMADPGERAKRAERGREAVLARHTFERRVETLLEWLAPFMREPA